MSLEQVSWTDVRRHFPITEEVVYLDSAAVGPMPDFLRDAHLRAFQDRLGGRGPGGFADIKQRAVAGLAGFLGVSGDELVFTATTTDAINTVAHSIDWKPGDEVVVNDVDFPSNLIPWIRLRERGVVVRAARSENGRLSLAAVEAVLSERTRLMALSHVFYQSGYRVDLEALGELLHRRGILLSVDGIQALGLLKPQLRHVDFYMGAVYKGLLGPFGLAILYLDRKTAESLTPEHVGYGSLAGDGIPWSGVFPYHAGSQRFQPASVNYPALHAVADVLEFLDGIGYDRVTERVLELGAYAIAALTSVPGVEIVTPKDSAHRLGIVAFRLSGQDSGAVAAALNAAGIRVAARDGNVRASFHVYNNEEDVGRLADAVRGFVRESRP